MTSQEELSQAGAARRRTQTPRFVDVATLKWHDADILDDLKAHELMI